MTQLLTHLKLNIKTPGDAISIPIQEEGLVAWRNARNGYTNYAIHFSADPEKNSLEWFEAETKGMKDDQIRREYLLDFSSRAGQRAFPYLEYSPERWLVRPFPIPKNWTIIAGLDFGGQNPTSIHFYAVDHRGRFTAFWEFYKPSTPSEIARVLKNHPLWDRVLKVVVDPSVFRKDQHRDDGAETGKIKSIGDMLEDLGIYNLERGVNDRIAGFQRVKHMLRYSEFNRELEPYLKFTTDCPNLWNELNGLTHKEQTPKQLIDQNLEEDVVKKNDHAYDELRYALMSWKVPSDTKDIPVLTENTFKHVEDEIEERLRHEEEDDYYG